MSQYTLRSSGARSSLFFVAIDIWPRCGHKQHTITPLTDLSPLDSLPACGIESPITKTDPGRRALCKDQLSAWSELN